MRRPRYIVTRMKTDRAVPARYQRAGWMAFDTSHQQHGQIWPTKADAVADARRLETKAARMIEQPARPTEAYRLPDGCIVQIYADTSRGAETITFQLKGGEVVIATRYTPDLDAFTAPPDLRCECCGEPAGEGGALCPACARNNGVKL